MTRAAFALAVALALISSGAAYSRSQAHPTTLVWANGQIVAFAQDGDRIAWATSVMTPAACPWQARIRVIATGQQKIVNPPGGRTCHSDTGFDISHQTNLALAGKRALWTLQDSGNSFYQQLVTGLYKTPPPLDVQLDELVFANNLGEGFHLGGIAGDSSTLVYGVVNVAVSGPTDCDTDGTCTVVVSGGSIKRVTGASTVTIPASPPSVMLAAAGSRVALVVAETASTDTTIGPASPAHVRVINATTGSSVGSFAPAGRPRAIAFSTSAVGVLVSVPGGKRIEFHSPAGALIRSVVVPTGATGLSMSSTQAVFRVGRSIRIVRVTSGAVRFIATAAATPIGLSIEDRRVAWAENVTIHHAKRGRVRAITVR